MTLLLVAITLIASCARKQHRLKADQDAYDVVAERDDDSRWNVKDYTIDIDPRSRYYDPNNPDRPPMPPDDPASNQYMLRVDGKKGWSGWDDNGVATELENPTWREALGEYVGLDEKGAVKLDIGSALRLAYLHSPAHQSQLETLYASALDVVTERFRLDAQFFGGYDGVYQTQDRLAPGGKRRSATVGRGSGAMAFPGGGGGSNALQMNKRFATAGELVVGLANSFMWELSPGDISLASSIFSASIVQPLLRGAGRDIALEQLTQTERTLLANLRAYSQYRQGFYTQVAIGELGVDGPRPGGAGTDIARLSMQYGLGGGFIGLLQQLQEIRNTEDSLSLQLRTLSLLEAHLAGGVIDLVQVDQFRQSIETERASLLQARNSFELSLERYKTGTLGLPPDLPVELDDSLIRKFQLVTREATAVQDSIANLQDRVGELSNNPPAEKIRLLLEDARKLVDPVRVQFLDAQTDVLKLEQAVSIREKTMTAPEKKIFARERKQLSESLTDLTQSFVNAEAMLTTITHGLSKSLSNDSTSDLVIWLGNLYRLAQGSILVQARARLEAVTVEDIEMESGKALETALENRLDFMNARAALVDSWRGIAVTADALQSNLSIAVSGEVRTTQNKALHFDRRTASGRAGLQFDAPFTRLEERHAYRLSLIDYQRNRRQFIQSRDSLHLGLRELLRQIELLRTNLEIQRVAVAIAIRRVDLTRADLYAPVRPPEPGQRPAQFGPTAATNMLNSLSSLRNTQNNFMSAWLNYYAARMRLARELGLMTLDRNGEWADDSASETDREEIAINDGEGPAGIAPPPNIPAHWVELANVTMNGIVSEPPPPGTEPYDFPAEYLRLAPGENVDIPVFYIEEF